MQNYGHIPISVLTDRFIDEYNLRDENVNMSLLKEQAVDIIKDFMTADASKHKIALLSIHNTRAKLPADFHTMISAAARIYENKKDCTTIQQVSEYTQKTGDPNCDLEIKVKCDKCNSTSCSCGGANTIEVDVDYIWKMQNPWYYNVSDFGKPISSTDLYGDYGKHNKQFKLLRHTTNPYHNVNYHLPDCVNLHCKDCDNSYRIDYPFIEVDFLNQNKYVELLVAYLAKPTDANGDLLIPDLTDAKEAILYGLAYKYFMSEFVKTSSQAARIIYTESEAKRDRSIGRLKTLIAIPDADEFRAQMSEINSRARTAGPTQLRTKTNSRLTY